MSAPVQTESSFVLLNPMWFFNHNYTAIVSYLKNSIFVRECSRFVDGDGNNLLHYFFFRCKKISRLLLLLIKWCVKIGVDMNQTNKKKITPFYYYSNFLFEKGLSDTLSLKETFFDICALWDRKSRHQNGNNILHVLACYPFSEDQFDFVIKTIDLFVFCLEEKNDAKQIPLALGLSTWRGKKSHRILYYLYLKTPVKSMTSLDSKGRNIFHLACEYGLSNVVKHMIKIDPGIVQSRIMDDLKTPILFRVIQNVHTDVIFFLAQRFPVLLTQLDEEGRNLLDWILNCYIIYSDPIYKTIFEGLCNKKIVRDTFPDYKKKYSNVKHFEKHGHYFCHICHEIKDPRNWESPTTCRSHPEKFHTSCIRKWLDVHQSCPMCEYKRVTACEVQDHTDTDTDMDMDMDMDMKKDMDMDMKLSMNAKN